ncbi:MAG: hypothetical protein DBY14_03850 [Escherichia coli]|nr:MAG: hypothetical protein DBY14_03850 [Escherichia coli]
MEREFYTISLYVDENENLIGIPCGESKKYGVADIDKVLLLKAPYSSDRLEKYVEEVIEHCYTKEHNDESDVSTIEKYTKVKGFVNATAPYTLISIVKTKDTYSLMPTFNDLEKGPLLIDDDEHILPVNYNAGELAEVIHGFIEVYVKANIFYKEIEEHNKKK